MQQLHLVGFTTDLDSLIFSSRKGAKSGSFVLPLDERLLVLIAEAVRRRKLEGDDIEVPIELRSPSSVVRRQSALSPREIQDRLRAGRSIEEVASEAGVAEEWVGRFSAPVEAERSQIIGRARRLVYAKPRRGDSGEALGPSVRWNLADRGVRLTNDEFDNGWSAYQLADHTWMVTFAFVSRKREQLAEWEVDLAEGEVLARNRLASDLAYLEPGRRRRSAASLQPGRPPTASRANGRGEYTPPPPPELPVLAGVTGIRSAPAKKAAANKAPAKKSATTRPAAKSAAQKPTARKSAAKKSAAKKAAAAGPAARKSAPKKAAATKPARKSAPEKAAAARPAARKSAAARPAASRSAARKTGAPARRPASKASARRAASDRSVVAATSARSGGRGGQKRPTAATRSAAATRGASKAATGPASKAATRMGASRPSAAAARPSTRAPGARPTSARSGRAAAAKRPTGKRAAAKRPAGGGSSGRLPPAPSTGAGSTAASEPNELSRRRLQLVTGGQPSTPRRSPMLGRAGYGGGPRAGGYPGGRRASTLASMSARPASTPAAARTPAADGPRDRQLDVVPEPEAAEENAAEARRAERRRARAEARQASGANRGSSRTAGGRGDTVKGGRGQATSASGPERGGGQRTPAAEPPAGPEAGPRTRPEAGPEAGPRTRPEAGPAATRILTSEPPAPTPLDVPEGDGRVVTIRANRATPPRGEAGGDVVLPPNRPPLRPAQPAALPRSRRRFGRNGR